jgi:ATP-dependent helicase/nuclease subunit B
VVAVVPTAEAGRRLREALALKAEERGMGVVAPIIITPELITGWAMEGMPAVATGADLLLTWMQVLLDVPLEEYTGLFPVPPVSRDTAWARSTAGELLRLRHRLEEGGRTIVEAARRLGAGHPEADRWADLARLETRASGTLKRYGLHDPVGTRLAAAARPVFPRRVSKVVMVAVPDPVHLVISALENAEAQGLAVEVLIHADEACADLFDAWGRPVPELWGDRVIDIPEPKERILLTARPEEEAEALVQALLRYAEKPESVAIGSADVAIASPLEDCAAQRGVAVFDPNGVSLGRHELTWMLTCLAGLLRTDTAVEAARLLRLPEVLRAAPADVTPRELLRDWDEFQQAHLPRTLTDAAGLSGRWKPLRKNRPEEPVPVLRPVLEWLHGECRLLRRKGDAGVLRKFMDTVYEKKTFDTEQERALFSAAQEQWNETLEAIAQAAERTGYEMDAATALETALHLLREARLYPENTERAPVLNGWLELPWQQAPHLVVAGLNEGMAPDSVTGDPWLPDSVRGVLDLKTNAIRLARDSYLLTSMIECRRRTGSVMLLAARESSAGDPLKPSRLLLRCPEHELADRALSLFPADGNEGTRPSPPSWHRAWKLRVPAPDPEADVFRKMSVTQFSDYLKCPFRFYLKHVLRMEPFDAGRDEMEARDFGSLIHDSVQALHENELLRNSTDEEALAGFLDDTIRRLTAERYTGDPALPLIIQLESARNRLRALARIHAAERAAGWQFEHVEVSFPEELEGVSISGRIDLIERHQETGERRVIDYKTGAKGTDPVKAHVKPLRGGSRELPDWQVFDYGGKPHAWINLQLPFYVWIVSRRGYDGVRAGYINLPVATSEAAVKMWEELDDGLVEAAIECARGVIRSIRQGRFWPPAGTVEYDDFEPLRFREMEESFDPALLEKFRELRVTEGFTVRT